MRDGGLRRPTTRVCALIIIIIIIIIIPASEPFSCTQGCQTMTAARRRLITTALHAEMHTRNFLLRRATRELRQSYLLTKNESGATRGTAQTCEKVLHRRAAPVRAERDKYAKRVHIQATRHYSAWRYSLFLLTVFHPYSSVHAFENVNLEI